MKKAPGTQDWLTRIEASDFLSCSSQTLANHERRGRLHPQHAYRPDGRGVEHRVIVYDPDEVNKLAKLMNRHVVISPRDPGELAAAAFALFDENKPEKDVVIKLRITPDAVRALREKWFDMGGADLVIVPPAKQALEKLLGAFDTVAELVERVIQLKADAAAQSSTAS
jgi:hypothetical protein